MLKKYIHKRVVHVSGNSNNSSKAGVFYGNSNNSFSNDNSNIGARLSLSKIIYNNVNILWHLPKEIANLITFWYGNRRIGGEISK